MGILLILFSSINVLVTVYFEASVESQRNAYATGVLVLIASSSLLCYYDLKQRGSTDGFVFAGLSARYFLLVAVGFVGLLLVVMVQALSGMFISSMFILAVLSLSVISRALRSDELRTVGFEFQDEPCKFLWHSLCLADFPVLVPHRPGRHERDQKEKQIREEHQLNSQVEVVFLEVGIGDPSNFYQSLLVEIVPEGKRIVIKVKRSVSVAHAIAAVAIEMSRNSKPPGIHFGWPEQSLLSASWSYFAFGEGNIPWKVRELILHSNLPIEQRPRVIVG